jgi:hypothetical protein
VPSQSIDKALCPPLAFFYSSLMTRKRRLLVAFPIATCSTCLYSIINLFPRITLELLITVVLLFKLVNLRKQTGFFLMSPENNKNACTSEFLGNVMKLQKYGLILLKTFYSACLCCGLNFKVALVELKCCISLLEASAAACHMNCKSNLYSHSYVRVYGKCFYKKRRMCMCRSNHLLTHGHVVCSFLFNCPNYVRLVFILAGTPGWRFANFFLVKG